MGRHTALNTQGQYPWRTVVRTAVQIVPGIALLVPVVVQTSGVEPTSAAVVGALAVSGAITRTMADPRVNEFLTRWAPWIAAEPRS
jgi:glucose dehydrogenase